jgi:hypothetical protein
MQLVKMQLVKMQMVKMQMVKKKQTCQPSYNSCRVLQLLQQLPCASAATTAAV